MAFKDFTEVVEPLELAYKGKVYRIEPPSGDDGTRFALAAEAQQAGEPLPEGLAPFTNDETFRVFLGAAWVEMKADKVPQVFIDRCLDAAMADHFAGRLIAQIMWETGGDPKAAAQYVKTHAPNRATRRSKSTGAAQKTP